MNITYIVCWVKATNINTTKQKVKDFYEVFIDDYEGAKAKYDKILAKDTTHSVSITKVIESSDYPTTEASEYSLHEAITNITQQVCANRFITEDSRLVTALIIRWAKEFEVEHINDNWGVDTELDYMDAIDQFTDIKIRDAITSGLGYIDTDNN